MKKIVFMSSPPISDTKRDLGMELLHAAATATTSWMSLPPTSGADEAAAGAGEEDAIAARLRGRTPFSMRSEELEHLLRLPGVVALVVLPAESGRPRPRPP